MTGVKELHPKATCSWGDPDVVTMSARLNEHASCTASVHTGTGVKKVLGSEAFEDFARYVEAVNDGSTTNFSASMSVDDSTLAFTGYLSAGAPSIMSGSITRPLTALHGSSVLNRLRLSIYAIGTDVQEDEAESISGSLPSRLLQLTDLLVTRGRERLAGLSNRLFDGLREADVQNGQALQAWRAVLRNSEDTTGYDSIKNLSPDSRTSYHINKFLLNQLSAARASFIQTVQAIAGAFHLFYSPGRGTGEFGWLGSAVKMLEDPAEVTLEGIELSLQYGMQGAVPPAGVIMTGLPFLPADSMDRLSWSVTRIENPAGVIYPKGAKSPLEEIGCPSWLPSVLLPTDEALELAEENDDPSRRFQSSEAELEAAMASLLLDEYAAEYAPVLEDYARAAWTDLRGNSATAHLTPPLMSFDENVWPGHAVTLKAEGGGSITGLVQAVRHELDINGRRATMPLMLSHIL